MIATIPMVKIADHRNSLGIGRPSYKGDTYDPLDISHLRAHFVMHKVVVTLTKEIHVVGRKCRQETIRIRKLASLPVVSFNV